MLLLLFFLFFAENIFAQKEPVRFGFVLGTSFYQPRIRLHQNGLLPGAELRGSVRTGDGGKGTLLFEFGYQVSRTPEERSFYSYKSGQYIRDAYCINASHFLTFAGTWRTEIFEEEKLSLLAGLQVNWLVRRNSLCQYQIDSARLREWQGPFPLDGVDRFYPVFATGAETRLLKSEKILIYLYLNAFHQLFAFSMPGDKGVKDPLLSSRYFAPFMGWNAGLRIFIP